MLDLSWAQGTPGGNVPGMAVGEILGIDGRARGLLVAAGHVDDVELATGGFLSDKLLGWVVRDVVPVDNVVIPVSAA